MADPLKPSGDLDKYYILYWSVVPGRLICISGPYNEDEARKQFGGWKENIQGWSNVYFTLVKAVDEAINLDDKYRQRKEGKQSQL
jgi:hypothetical protein